MPLDVLEKLNNAKQEAKQEATSNEQLTQNLDVVIEKLDIITEKAKSSTEAMNALDGIVSGLAASGNNLSQSLDKVCFYFERFEERSIAAKVSAFGLNDAYSKLGKDAPSQFNKIITSLQEVKTIQNDLAKGTVFGSVDQVQILTKEVMKLKNALKNMPKLPSGGGSPVGKFASGGEIPGNSTTGDKVPILVNSGEYILNKAQMTKLGKMMGGKSPRQAFQALSGRSSDKGGRKNGFQAFASGGFVSGDLPNYIKYLDKRVSSSGQNYDKTKRTEFESKLRKLNRLLKIIKDNNIDDQDVDKHIVGPLTSNGHHIMDSLEGLTSKDVDGLIDIFSKSKNDKHNYSGSLSGSKAKTKEGKLFSDAASKARAISNSTSDADVKKEYQTKTRESGAIGKQVDRISKNGSSTHKARLEEVKQKYGINSSDDVLGLTENELKGLNSEIEEIIDSVGELENEISDVTENFESTTKEVNKLFKDFGIGQTLAMAGMLLIGQTIKNIFVNIQDFIKETAKLNLEMQRVQQNMNALGGSVNLDAVRDGLNLTRKEALALGEAYKEMAMAGLNGMESVSVIASNLKNALGEVDTGMLKEAVNLIKDLPKEQVDVLITGTGSFDDKANLITNLLNEGKLEKTIDLMMNGAFGEMDGSAKLSEKDKALVDAQKQATKVLEDIKFSLYDWIPEWMGKTAIIVGSAATIGAAILKGYMTLRGITMGVGKLSSAAGFGFINVKEGMNFSLTGGKGVKGGKGGLKATPAGIAIAAAVGHVVGKIIQEALHKKSQDIIKERDYRLQINSAKNLKKYGHTMGDVSEWHKEQRDSNAVKGAADAQFGGLTTAFGAAIGMAVAGPLGAVVGGLITTALAGFIGGLAGYFKDTGNPFEGKNAMDEKYYKDTLKKIDEIYKELYGGKNGQKMMLKELIQANVYNKKLNAIVSGKKNALEHDSIEALIKNLQMQQQTGGSNYNYSENFFDLLKSRTKLFSREANSVNIENERMLGNKNIGASTKAALVNQMLKKQAELVSKFNSQLQEILDQLFKAPEILKRELENNLRNMGTDFGNEFWVAADFNDLSDNTSNAVKNIEDAYALIIKARKAISEIAVDFERTKQAAIEAQKATGYGPQNINQAKELVEEWRKHLDSQFGSGFGDMVVNAESLQGIVNNTNIKTPADVMSHIDTAMENLSNIQGYYAQTGNTKDAEQAGLAYKQLEEIKKKLSDPSISEKEKAALIAQFKSVLAVALTHSTKEQLEKAAALKKGKFKGIDNAQLAIILNKAINGSQVNADNMKKNAENKAFSKYIETLRKSAEDINKQIRNAFNSGTIQFTNALLEVLGKSREYDELVDALHAAEANITALSTKTDLLADALQKSHLLLKQVDRVLFGEKRADGSVKTRDINGRYEEKANETAEGRKRLAEEEKNGVADYRRKQLELVKLKRAAMTTSSAKEQAELIQKVMALEKELDSMEMGNKAIADWKSGAGKDWIFEVAGLSAKLSEFLKGQSDWKESMVRSFKEIGDSVKRAMNDGVVRLCKAIADAASTRADYHNKYGNYKSAVADARNAIDDSSVAFDEGHKKAKEGYNLGLAKAKEELKKRLDDAETQKNPEEARKAAWTAYALEITRLEKERFENMKKLNEDYVQKVAQLYEIQIGKINRLQESIDIEKDLANTIGAPFEYIVELEKATVQMAREKTLAAQQELELIKARGIEGETLEKAKLKVQKAQAEELKAMYGAQRDAIDKMLGKIMGTFTELDGIFGPQSAKMMAKKYGQGYLINEAGLAVRSDGSQMGYNGRVKRINPTDSMFATGGKVGGNSKSGDNVLALVNSGEYIMNPKQMENLKNRLGAVSHDEVFALANKELPQFAKGGTLGGNPQDYLFPQAGVDTTKRSAKVDMKQYRNAKSLTRYGFKRNKDYRGAYEISISDALKFKGGTRFKEDLYDEEGEKRKRLQHNADMDKLVGSGRILDATPNALMKYDVDDKGNLKKADGQQRGGLTTKNATTSSQKFYQAPTGQSSGGQVSQDKIDNIGRSISGGNVGNVKSEENGEKGSESDVLNKILKALENLIHCVCGNLQTISSAEKKSTEGLVPYSMAKPEKGSGKSNEGSSSDVKKSESGSGKPQQGGSFTDAKNANGKNLTSVPPKISAPSEDGSAKIQQGGSSSDEGSVKEQGRPIRVVENERALAKFLQNPCKKKDYQKDILDVAREIRDILRGERGSGNNNGGKGGKDPYEEVPGELSKNIYDKIKNQKGRDPRVPVDRLPDMPEDTGKKFPWDKTLKQMAMQLGGSLLNPKGFDFKGGLNKFIGKIKKFPERLKNFKNNISKNVEEFRKNPKEFIKDKLKAKFGKKVGDEGSEFRKKPKATFKQRVDAAKQSWRNHSLPKTKKHGAGDVVDDAVKGKTPTTPKALPAPKKPVAEIPEGKNSLSRVPQKPTSKTETKLLTDGNVDDVKNPTPKGSAPKTPKTNVVGKSPNPSGTPQTPKGWDKDSIRRYFGAKKLAESGVGGEMSAAENRMAEMIKNRGPLPKGIDKLTSYDESQVDDILKNQGKPNTGKTPNPNGGGNGAKPKAGTKPTTPKSPKSPNPNSGVKGVKPPISNVANTKFFNFQGTPGLKSFRLWRPPTDNILSGGVFDDVKIPVTGAKPIVPTTTALAVKSPTTPTSTALVKSPTSTTAVVKPNATPNALVKSPTTPTNALTKPTTALTTTTTPTTALVKPNASTTALVKPTSTTTALAKPDVFPTSAVPNIPQVRSFHLSLTNGEARFLNNVGNGAVDWSKNLGQRMLDTRAGNYLATNGAKAWNQTTNFLARNGTKAADATVGFFAGRPVTPGAGSRFLGRYVKPAMMNYGGKALNYAGKGLTVLTTATDSLEALDRANNLYTNWNTMDTGDKIQNSALNASQFMKIASNFMGPGGILARGVLDGGEWVANDITNTSNMSAANVAISGEQTRWHKQFDKNQTRGRGNIGVYRSGMNVDEWSAAAQKESASLGKVYDRYMAKTNRSTFKKEGERDVQEAYDNNTTYLDWMYGDGAAQAAKNQAYDNHVTRRSYRARHLSAIHDLGTTGGGGFGSDDIEQLEDIASHSSKNYQGAANRMFQRAKKGAVGHHKHIMKTQNNAAAQFNPDVMFDSVKIAGLEDAIRNMPGVEGGENGVKAFRKLIQERREQWTQYAKLDAELAKEQERLVGELEKNENPFEAPVLARKIKDISERRKELHTEMNARATGTRKGIDDFYSQMEQAGAIGSNKYDANKDGNVTEKELAEGKKAELNIKLAENQASVKKAQEEYDSAKTALGKAQGKDEAIALNQEFAKQSGGYVPTFVKNGKRDAIGAMLATHDSQGNAISAEDAKKKGLYARMYRDEKGNLVPITDMSDQRYQASFQQWDKGKYNPADIKNTNARQFQMAVKGRDYNAALLRTTNAQRNLDRANLTLETTQGEIRRNDAKLSELGDSEGKVVLKVPVPQSKPKQPRPDMSVAPKNVFEMTPEELKQWYSLDDKGKEEWMKSFQKTPSAPPVKKEEAPPAKEVPPTPSVKKEEAPSETPATPPVKKEEAPAKKEETTPAPSVKKEGESEAPPVKKEETVEPEVPAKKEGETETSSVKTETPVTQQKQPRANMSVAPKNVFEMTPEEYQKWSSLDDKGREEWMKSFAPAPNAAQQNNPLSFLTPAKQALGSALAPLVPQTAPQTAANPVPQQPVASSSSGGVVMTPTAATPISKEAVSEMQRREAAGQKMFGESGSVDGKQANPQKETKVEVTVNVKFNSAMFEKEVVRIATTNAQSITTTGMNANG